MNQETIRQKIYEMRHYRTELYDVEAKAAKNNHPNELWKTISAFANSSNGGIIICGLDDESFKAVDIYNVQKLHHHFISIASQMVPPLCLQITPMEFEGKTIVVAEIPTVSLEQRPCYYGPEGLYEGSYIRVSTSKRRMTQYEVSICLSNRYPTVSDMETIKGATLEDLDRTKLEAYFEHIRRIRSEASYTNQPFDQLAKTLKIIVDDNGIVRPSLAGMLVFGKWPQQFEPQLVVTFMRFHGMTETELSPSGERFLDDQRFEGSIPEMTELAYKHILKNIQRGSAIRGLYRQIVTEYPEIAIREAIINAVAHRDYSPLGRGSQIQIKQFSDRLEIISPGGLYGSVALENLEEGQSTRNRLLMRFLEDLNIVENRGSGIDAMVNAIKSAGLNPPKFEDRITNFQVTLYNTQQKSDEARILDYVHEHGSIRRVECQSLLKIDGRRATYILREMKNSGLLKQEGTHRGTYYVLP